MSTISLCMIVRDEEKHIRRCLDSVKSVIDEIIIVDTGSTDSTKEIVAKYTPNIFDFEWIDDFAAARNFAFSKATMDYQMWLDADDVVPPETVQKLRELKKALDTAEPVVDVVTMKYITHVDENGKPILTSTRERLLRRESHFQWEDPIHEFIQLGGNILDMGSEIHHLPIEPSPSDRNLLIYSGLEEKGHAFTPRQLYYYARELKDHGKNIQAIHYFEKFLATKQGWMEDNIASCYNLSVLYASVDDRDKVLPILAKSFEFGSPRAEIFCQYGYYFLYYRNYQIALDWFQAAMELEVPSTHGFILWEHWGYIPHIESGVCQYYLGKYKESFKSNTKAGELKPGCPFVEKNFTFLAEKGFK